MHQKTLRVHSEIFPFRRKLNKITQAEFPNPSMKKVIQVLRKHLKKQIEKALPQFLIKNRSLFLPLQKMEPLREEVFLPLNFEGTMIEGIYRSGSIIKPHLPSFSGKLPQKIQTIITTCHFFLMDADRKLTPTVHLQFQEQTTCYKRVILKFFL